MALSNALFSSVSGLNTTSTAISVIGDNIANVNTTGFKERRAEFSDVLGQNITSAGGFSALGAGSKLSRVTTSFTQGTFENTGRTTDMAIQGRGFFMLDGPKGNSYTRAGIFTVDNQGTLVNPEGLRVQGFGIDPTTSLSNGQLGDITISNALAPPQPSALIDLSLNLEAGDDVYAGFDPADPSRSSNYNAGLTLYDSLGSQHFSKIYFTNRGGGAWDWNATLDSADTTIAPVSGGDENVVQGSGTLTFDANGILTGMTGTPVTYEFSGGATGSQSVAIDFGAIGGTGTVGQGTTSYDEESTTNSASQDGFGAGTLQSISVESDGIVSGNFSNGANLALAQVVLAGFPNVEGLAATGGNNLAETRASGQPLFGTAESGSFGTVRSGNLEQSTVDLAGQFVKLIVNQRAFQANTRTVSVTNELMANLVSLGQ